MIYKAGVGYVTEEEALETEKLPDKDFSDIWDDNSDHFMKEAERAVTKLFRELRVNPGTRKGRIAYLNTIKTLLLKHYPENDVSLRMYRYPNPSGGKQVHLGIGKEPHPDELAIISAGHEPIIVTSSKEEGEPEETYSIFNWRWWLR